VLQLMARQKDLNFRPGDEHLYCNTGYTLLATIVKRVSGQTFREFTTERLFKPLGMTRHVLPRRLTARSSRDRRTATRPSADTFRLSVTNFDTPGATSLHTTVEDLALWDRNFDDGRVGGRSFFAALLKKRGVLERVASELAYASGLTHGTYRGLRSSEHGGSDAGYRAEFLRFPVMRIRRLGAVQRRVGEPDRADAEGRGGVSRGRHAARSRGRPLRRKTTSLRSRWRPSGWRRSPGSTGTRRSWPRAGSSSDGGRLYALAGRGRQPLKSLGDGRFVSTSGPRTPLVFEAGGSAPRLSVGTSVFERREPFAPTPAQLAEFAGTYRSDEFELAYRIVVHEGGLRLERMKSPPAALQPLVADRFTGQPGTITFVRDGSGRITGFLLDAGRVRHVKFRREIVSGT
jgi:hypothetical protein